MGLIQDKNAPLAAGDAVAEAPQPAPAGAHGSDLMPTEAVGVGHRCTLLVGGTAAYDRMLELIDAARESVDLETYIYRADAIGDGFRSALTAAAGRGVRVRVLVDAYGSESLPAGYFASLTASGAKVLWFNPKRLLRLSFRNHRKLLRCDGTAVVGGLNIAEEYDGDGVARGWRDFAVEVDGGVVRALAESFERMWELAPFGRRQIRQFWTRRPRARGASAGVPDAELLLSGSGCPTAEMRSRLARDIRAARCCFAWAAYFLPSRRLRKALRVAARAGEASIVLSARSDVPTAGWASEYHFARLLRAGIRLHRYRPQIMHAKLVVADDVVYVGSANLDARSLRINFELLLRVRSRELASRLREEFAADVARSDELELERWTRKRTWWQRLRSYVAYQLLARLDPFLANRRFKSLQ